MDSEYKKLLKSQGYGFLGEHSALKICGWTKRSLVGKGVCYKEQFYGIRCHRCVQMSVTVNFCDMNCLHCWRKRHNEKFNVIDDPDEILDKIFMAQYKKIAGYLGNAHVDIGKFEEAKVPKHIAISLTGETLYYPKLDELLKKAHKRGYTSFIVTNGSQPKILRKMVLPTQLYISINAPDEKLFLKVNRPMKKTAWMDVLRSLDVMKEIKKKTRTAIRITCIKGINMVDPEGYAKLITKASPHFVEVKAYMLLGESCNRLVTENMPPHNEVKKFGLEIAKHCGYRLIDEHVPSRVVLLMKKDFKGRIMKF